MRFASNALPRVSGAASRATLMGSRFASRMILRTRECGERGGIDQHVWSRDAFFSSPSRGRRIDEVKSDRFAVGAGGTRFRRRVVVPYSSRGSASVGSPTWASPGSTARFIRDGSRLGVVTFARRRRPGEGAAPAKSVSPQQFRHPAIQLMRFEGLRLEAGCDMLLHSMSFFYGFRV